jgi:hypothetical protein
VVQLGQQTTGSAPVRNPYKAELDELHQLERAKFAIIDSNQDKSVLELARE